MKIYLDSVGCRLNQSEIEKMGSQFRAAGHTLVADAAEADLVVINTCTVTSSAASDSRGKIRQANQAGKASIIVTGCWATLEADSAAALPGVVRVIPNEDKDRAVAEVLDLPDEDFDLEPISRQPLPGIHARTRAFIKVQDGCDNHCTFCITRLARGKGRSISMKTILQDIRGASTGQAQEIVLTGVHLASWGHDLDPAQHLSNLVEVILAETDIPRLRLSSLESWDLDEAFFRLWQNPRVCRQLHLPLQSGCSSTLHRMARKITPDEYSRLVQSARTAFPDIAITTDIIVGFPGESDADFAESLSFVHQMQFSAGHVFTYSPRPGTPAAAYPDQVPVAVRKSRGAEMRTALAESSLKYRQQFIGNVMPVLWESVDAIESGEWQLKGLTGNYMQVTASAHEPLWNHIMPVKLEKLTSQGFSGTIT